MLSDKDIRPLVHQAIDNDTLNFGRNALGCEPQLLEDVLVADRRRQTKRVSVSTQAIGRKVVVYAKHNLGINLTRDDEVEPVFAEVLLELRNRKALTLTETQLCGFTTPEEDE